MVPKGRTGLYAIWKACERFGILPPWIKTRWEDNVPYIQGHLIAYSQIRDHEEFENQAEILKAMYPKV